MQGNPNSRHSQIGQCCHLNSLRLVNIQGTEIEMVTTSIYIFTQQMSLWVVQHHVLKGGGGTIKSIHRLPLILRGLEPIPAAVGQEAGQTLESSQG